MFFRNVVVGLVFTVLSSVALAVPGQPGTLDLTYGTAGWSARGGWLDSLPFGALQSTGKLVLVGRCDGFFTSEFIDRYSVICGWRVTQDGQTDTFPLRYQVVETIIDPITGFPTSRIRYTSPSGMAVQQDDKILVVGDCYVSKCVLRFLPDAPLDASFGANGVSTIPFAATAIQVMPDGRILVAGQCASGICVMRLLANGTTDTTFGSAGSSVISLSPQPAPQDYAEVRLGLYADGRIVIGTTCLVGADFDFCGFRLLANGTLDSSFGVGGQFTATIGPANDIVSALVVTADNKVILAGSCQIAGGDASLPWAQCALRIDADGSLDQCFGAPDQNSSTCTGTGTASFVPTGDSSAFALGIALESSGKILLAGLCQLPGTLGGDRICVSRLSASGSLDLSFGDEGFALVGRTPITGDRSAGSSILLASASKAVIGAGCGNTLAISTASGYFCAARFDLGSAFDCSLDLDGDGRVLPLTDGLINLRVSFGIKGAAVLNGINFSASATRRTWPAIRDFMVKSCGLSIPK